MTFNLRFTSQAKSHLQKLEKSPDQSKRYRAVLKTLGLLERDPRHPGLQTHKYEALLGPNSEDIFEAYAENRTPAAFRIFWCYGPARGQITVIAITAHP